MYSKSFHGFMDRAKIYLAHRNVPFVAAALSAVLVSPSLWSGWCLDDVGHRLSYDTSEEARDYIGEFVRTAGPMRMYAFMGGEPEQIHRYMDVGVAPWWTYEKVMCSFWRPLAALTHVVDYSLWPDRAFVMHLQSVLWLTVLVIIAGILYRNVMGTGWCAGLATLMYAVSSIHGIPAAMLANRHALIAAIFGMLTLMAHDRWRRESCHRWACVSWVLMGVALLTAESGVAAFAYLLSYTLFLDRGPAISRIKALVPYVILIVAWRMVYDILGYGALGSEMYIDPGREPVRFIAALLERAPFYLTGVIGGPPAALHMLLSTYAARLYAGVAAAVLIGMGWLLYPIWGRDRIARFWGFAAILSVVPVCATFPSERNLTFAGIGAMGLIARMVFLYCDPAVSLPGSRIWRIPVATLGVAVLFIRLVCAPVGLGIESLAPKAIHIQIERLSDIGLPEPETAEKDLILVNPPACFPVMCMYSIRFYQDKPRPAHTRILSTGFTPVELHRLDENTIVVRPDYGYLPPPGPLPGQEDAQWMHLNSLNVLRLLDRLIRDGAHPMRVGQVVRLTGVNIEVTDLTPDGRPGEATFRFDRPLEDDSMVWLQWMGSENRYGRFPIPAVGGTARLE